MPFFLRKRGGSASKPSQKGKRNFRDTTNKPQSNEADKHNEELSSDEEIPSDEEVLGPISGSDSELDNETPQEKRLRLAKEYLSQVEAEVDEEADSEDDGGAERLITKRLEHDARKAKGKHFVAIADDLLEPQPSDIIILRGHQLSLTCLVISPDNKYVYTGSKDCSLIKWSIADRKKVYTVHGGRKGTEAVHLGHTSHILSLAISTSGKYLVSGDQNSKILVWDPVEMRLLHTFKGHKGAITGLAFQRGSHQLFSASADKSVKVWNVDEMAYVETVFGHQDGVQSIDAMMGEKAITVGGRDRTVRLWKIVEESQLVFNGSGGSMDCVALIDEEKFVTGSDTNQICVWKTMKKWPMITVSNAHDGAGDECWISALRALRNTDLIASGSKTGDIKLWKLPARGSLEAVHSIAMPGFINDLQFASNGKFLAAAVGQEHKLGRWWRLKDSKNCLAIVNLPRKVTKSVLKEL